MTVRERGLREARRVAREVTKRWGIKSAEDIRIEAIAKAEGLRIIEGPLRGARGRLSSGPKPVIRIAEDVLRFVPRPSGCDGWINRSDGRGTSGGADVM